VAPHNFAEIRAKVRSELGVEHHRNIVLMVGSDYKRKGVDRAIRAMAALSGQVLAKTILLVAGKGQKKPLQRLARKLGIAANVIFLGARDDIPGLLLASDLLLHPAYSENTGTVLIEALASGLPVLTTAVCGYSHHVERAAAGKIVPSPFQQETLNQLLMGMLTSEQKKQWQLNARAYVAATDVFSRAEKAADIIEKVAARKKVLPQ
jgi:UDP-glucose:(heptosyl)LPS alpha-1,3-glucosyltransferase